ncbi:MAG: hypothetical protein RMA76_26865 [Deltaproteobacteria bacterium]|jgi:hypothetical protein
MDYTNYRVSHKTMEAALPADTDICRQDWARFVARTDAMDMNRPDRGGHGYKDNASNHYEGQWLKDWIKCRNGENLTKGELRMAPLFTDLTTPLDDLDRIWSDWNFASVRWEDVRPCSDGDADLRALAKRIAETSLENRDGETDLVHLRAVTDAWDALTSEEQKAMPNLLKTYFGRDVSVKYEKDGIGLTFRNRETPTFAAPLVFMKRTAQRNHDYSFEGGFSVPLSNDNIGGRDICAGDENKGVLWFENDRGRVDIDAPAGSRVVIRALDGKGKCVGDYLATQDLPKPRAYLAMAAGCESGTATFDLSDLPDDARALAVFVVRDADGPASDEAPRAIARMKVPLPSQRFYRVADNEDRRAALEANPPA